MSRHTGTAPTTPAASDTQHTYTLVRELDASAAEIFAAWTTPERYERWAGAEPGSVRMDVRPGGAWQAVMLVPGGQRAPIGGTYREVESGRRLVLDMELPGEAEPTVMTMELAERSQGAERPEGGRTRLTLSQVCASAAERDMAEEGSGMLLDSLTAHLAER
ncbi:SRPBCC domain-containing protein [Streptomyces carminius]|uniref:SRPBCC domain-containing protein n=1 Tax=Streptomyces carminius TaxID=2665496 RepID=A0A2M8LS09_9ACTN|nr:SRPBCC domain-containing protein [Streptomyces carminius]PJE94753.1 SRPBCC domain-containing protein [Streptomyces carminius]